ncbi:MAG TPA: mercuric transporter MerT family protein [Edaphobacter sp.]|jgi:mercuric ion transport protein|nr:mercuric transporter MerT family protein [Edaphobacter sp.]
MRSRLNAKTALAGGVLASIGASVCCVGPLLLLSLGIGGAWIGNLTALEPYRPVFILLVLLFLGLALRRLYFAPQSCDSEADCIADRTGNAQRIVFWIVAPLLLGLVAIPWLMPLLYR